MTTNTEKIFSSYNNPFNNFYQGSSKRLLFVCSAGMLRSPTAAAVAVSMGHNARSCGSKPEYALILISTQLILWADKIYFMQEKNRTDAMKLFSSPEILGMLEDKSTVWDIEDIYNYNAPELVRKIVSLL